MYYSTLDFKSSPNCNIDNILVATSMRQNIGNPSILKRLPIIPLNYFWNIRCSGNKRRQDDRVRQRGLRYIFQRVGMCLGCEGSDSEAL